MMSFNKDPSMSTDLTRRQVLGASAAAATTAAFGVTSLRSSVYAAPSSSQRAFIHLFLPGGWATQDLWDPRPLTPFRAGMRGSELLSTTGPRSTTAPAIQIGRHWHHTAEVMHHAAIIRSLVHADTDADSNATDHRAAQRRMLDSLTFSEPAEEILVAPHSACGLASALVQAAHSVEAGRRCVRVTLSFEPFQGFDAHEFGSRRSVEMANLIDMPLAAMVHQLEGMGLLDRTLLCVSSEFSRTIAGGPWPQQPAHTGENLTIHDVRDYGFHAHFAQANSVVLFGAGIRGGAVIGRTADRHPMRVIENPVTLDDLHATVAAVMGWGSLHAGRAIAI
jgi:hypothetical protein